MSVDYSSLLLNSGLSATKLTEILTNTASSNVSSLNSDSDVAQEFQDVLSEATTKLSQAESQSTDISETQALIDSLDKSILGQVASTIDMTELSEDLLKSSGKDNVIEQLIDGQMNSIVTTKQDDDDGFDISKTATGQMTLNNSDDNSHSVEESLDEIVAKLSAIVAQL